MWVIFEGLDKVGKGTLEREVLKLANYKHIVIDRGPVGYMVFDKLRNRETKVGFDRFVRQARKVNKDNSFIVVFVTASEEDVNARLEAHGEKQLDCGKTYMQMHKLYERLIKRYYKQEKVLTVNTSNRSISDCAEQIVDFISEKGKYGEL